MNFTGINDIIGKIEYKTFKFGVHTDDKRFYLQIYYECDDQIQSGRKWFLSPHMTKSEIVQTAFLAALTFEEHECREMFLYKNKNIFSPHYDVDVLHGICDVDHHDARM